MICVTGGRGFIGKKLCERLKRDGHEYRILDRPEYDIKDLKSLEFMFVNHTVDTVVHLAAISHVPHANIFPRACVETNINGTVNMLTMAKQYKVKKFIYVSSSSVTKPKNVYAVSKLSAEMLTSAYHRLYNLPTTIVRTASVYGPGDRHRRVVNTFVDKALAKQPIEVEGDGKQLRQFTYIDDLIDGLVCVILAKKTEGKEYNIAGEKLYTLNDLAKVVEKLTKYTVIKHKKGRKVSTTRHLLDVTNDIGYTPKYDLEKGVKEVIKWRKSVSTV